MNIYQTLCLMGLCIFIGICIGSIWQENTHQSKCDLIVNGFFNDTDVWIDYNYDMRCYDRIDCQKMYDRNKGHHQAMSINY